MKIEKAIYIAKREWDNIKYSLKMCGDIGEFNHSDFVDSSFNGLLIVRNIIEMENKFPNCRDFSSEANYVFTTLASRAGERIGLTKELAKSFGSGYSWVRTGFFNPNCLEKQSLIKQLFFFKLFFPLGVYFDWDFKAPVVKTKLNLVFYKFITWQHNPNIYFKDVREYKTQLEPLWQGLSSAIGFPSSFPE